MRTVEEHRAVVAALLGMLPEEEVPLAAAHGRVLSRDEILDWVWQYDFGGNESIVELYVSYLRRKLDSGRAPMIHTVRGAGYVLEPASA